MNEREMKTRYIEDYSPIAKAKHIPCFEGA
jgi:hypothetical protein